MKKLTSLILSAVLLLATLAACAGAPDVSGAGGAAHPKTALPA
uniref:Uncharacterized protein n=1 Tax=uncultured bacterium contig00154 TaxID=1181592 RepID=A0A806KKL1_9BACT|nr:hypothetical protein [uncultured bacterium contig00154]